MEEITRYKKAENKTRAGETGNKDEVGATVAEITIYPRKLAFLLVIAALVLSAINLLGVYLEKVAQSDSAFTRALVFFFDVGREANIPTLFSTLILALAALQLWLISRMAENRPETGSRRQWLILAGIFLFLAIDEATSVHEQFNKLRNLTQDQTGYLYYTWILPYAAFALLTGLYFLGFLRRLPPRTRRLFIISGLVFVAAAIGFEPLQGRVLKIYEIGHLYDKLLSSAEELLEMLSIALFNYALADYLSAAKARIGFAPSLSSHR